MTEIHYRSAASLADAIKRKELSSVEVVEIHLNLCQAKPGGGGR